MVTKKVGFVASSHPVWCLKSFMKRLRSRMIAAFMGMVLLAMIPLSFIPYYALTSRHHKVLTSILEGTSEEIEQDINKIGTSLQGFLFKIAEIIQEILNERSYVVYKFETCQSSDDSYMQSWKDKILQVERYRQALGPTDELEIIPKKQYLEMESWLREQNFYEDENGKIYLCCLQKLFKGGHADEMEVVGGILIKRLMFEKIPGRLLQVFRGPRFYDPNPKIIDPSPSHLKPFLPEDKFKRLYDFDEDGVYEEVDVYDVQLNNISGLENLRVKAKFKPVINHRGELAGVMILAYPIVDVWNMIGIPTFWGALCTLILSVAAAVMMARLIARPINELAQAAGLMSKGQFDVRVQVQGTEEQRVLSSTFNQLADRVEKQLVQLRNQTEELESSNHELHQTQRFLENLLRHIHTGVMSVDCNGQISHVNQAVLNILKIEKVDNLHLEEAVKFTPFVNLIRYSLNNAKSIFEEEIQYQTISGEKIPLQISTVPLFEYGALTGLVVTIHDLSSIRELEEQLRRHDRLVSLGRMAAGVAHEIRNPLGIIRGSAELLKRRFGGLPGEEGLSDFIIEEVNRLSRVVTDFLMFARPPVPDMEEISVKELADDVLSYVGNQPDMNKYESIEEIEEDLPLLMIDVELFRQAYLNLWLNACQAMPEGGKVTTRAWRRNRKEVVIEVKDEGMGISPDSIDRIFDPFYTSKDNGTGLGLSLVHQIVASHNGRVEVESVSQEGSTFRLIFPVHEAVSYATAGESS